MLPQHASHGAALQLEKTPCIHLVGNMRRRVWWLPLVAMLEVNMMRAQDLSVGTAQATAPATGGHVEVQFTTGSFHGNVEALQRAVA